LGVSTYLPMWGIRSKSTALLINFRSMPSFSSLKFYIVILFIFNTKFEIYCDILKGTAFIVFLYKHSIEMCSSFSSLSRHDMDISYPLCLSASMTFHSIITTVASLTYFSFSVMENNFLLKEFIHYIVIYIILIVVKIKNTINVILHEILLIQVFRYF
jgi:hypothetical protein